MAAPSVGRIMMPPLAPLLQKPVGGTGVENARPVEIGISGGQLNEMASLLFPKVERQVIARKGSVIKDAAFLLFASC